VIAAVATVYNEADIIGWTVQNLLGWGVDRIYVAHGPSTDGTLEVLESFLEVVVVPDDAPVHLQPEWTWQLSQLAERDGADWVIPFDADEFVYTAGPSIPHELARVPVGVNKIRVERWQHLTVTDRYLDHERLPKVAWRTGLPITTTPGNHDVIVDGGTATDVLQIRELQFRSRAHMARKCRERVDRIDPTLPQSAGLHQRELAVLDATGLDVAWEVRALTTTVADPIPFRSRTGVSLPVMWE
jgi:hypothetical protein